jgi:hypothetical protein
MSYPACFETQEQFDQWNKAADNVYHYGARARPSYCTDCTPDYSKRMQREGRCEYPDIKFYRCGNSFMGIHNTQQAGNVLGEEWELVKNEQTEPHAAVTCADA